MKRAEISTEVGAPDVVAEALRPDNTPEMETRTDGGAVVTTVERETTAGLRSTVDDYIVNLEVARTVLEYTNP